MLYSIDYSQGRSARSRRECEQPDRRWCEIALFVACDADGVSWLSITSSLNCIAEATRCMSTPTGAAVTVDVVSRISSLKLKLSPRGNYFRAKTKSAAEPIRCRKSLVRGLSIDVEYSSKTENEVRPFVQIRQHSRHWGSPSSKSPNTPCRDFVKVLNPTNAVGGSFIFSLHGTPSASLR